jgi:hypothetical protein
MNQLHHGVPLRLVQLQPVGPMTTRDHQAVPLAHGIGIGDAERIQVAEVACAALVPGHDVVHLKGPLVRSLLSNSPRRSTRSG